MINTNRNLTKLTRPTYTQLLRIVAGSSDSMSSYQIKKEMEKAGFNESNSPYVYEMIKELLGVNAKKTKIFFSWKQIPGESKYEQKLIDVINECFGMNLSIENDIIFKKSQDQKSLYVTINHQLEVVTKLHDEDYGGSSISLYENSKLIITKNLYCDWKQESVYAFRSSKNFEERLTDELKRSPVYLNSHLDKKKEQIITKLQEERRRILDKVNENQPIHTKFSRETNELDVKLSRLVEETKGLRYSMNIRGLILYLMGEVSIQNVEGKIRNRRISKVLSNLSNNYLQEFPFLLHYDYFRSVFDNITRLHHIPKYYEIEIIKEIAIELQNLVHYETEPYLTYWITRRYSNGIAQCFRLAYEWDLSLRAAEGLDDPLLKKFRKYQLHCIQIIIGYLSNQVQEMNNISNNLRLMPGLIDYYQPHQYEIDVDSTLFTY